MKINRSQLNALSLHIFSPLPVLFGVSPLAFVFLFWAFLRSGNLRNLVVTVSALLIAGLSLYLSPLFNELSGQLKANAFLMTFSTALLLLSPILRFQLTVLASYYTDVGICLFLLFNSFLIYNGQVTGATLQIACFSIILYLFVADTWFRRFIAGFAVIVAGARSIGVAVIVGLIFLRWRRSAKTLVVFFCLGLLGFIFLGDGFDKLNIWLDHLRSEGILLKGRTTFWLTLISNEVTWFGRGTGFSVQAVTDRVGRYHLPHNEYLRILFDFGLVALVMMLLLLTWNGSRREPHKRFATVLLAFFMLTGNPLSYPSVIVSYLLIMHAKIETRLSRE